ncbi:MAG: FHA domain-containing protein [Planctomycetia bacterium]|nr:FHA domain-containing protein [Planctomycetia bacterium]
MKVNLKVVDCKVDRDEVTLELPATLGRGNTCDLVIVHREISRQHCRLFVHKNFVHIQDLQSLNGTSVGERTISNAEIAIRPGERFKIGPITFEIDYLVEPSSSSQHPIPSSGSTSRRLPRNGSSNHLAPVLRSEGSVREKAYFRNAPTEKVEN